MTAPRRPRMPAAALRAGLLGALLAASPCAALPARAAPPGDAPARPARDPVLLEPATVATPQAQAGEQAQPGPAAGARALPCGRCDPCDPLRTCGPLRGCGDLSLGAHGTVLPNIGASLRLSRVVARSATATWSVELELGAQPIDDKDVIDGPALAGQPPNSGYAQALLGVVRRSNPAARRHWLWRAGAFVLDAGDEPNWVDTPGVWAGAYVGVGFEVDLTPALSMGPMLTLLAGAPVEQQGNFDVVPQLSWGVTWWPGARARTWEAACPCRPRGEVYVDVAASALPGVPQGAIGLGQVFARTPAATWSFEALASFQHLQGGTLQGAGDGDLAQLTGGVKATLAPQARTHLALRSGFTWLRATADTDTLGRPGDWLGAYASVGVEWDLSRTISTGPEALLAVLLREGVDGTVELQPRLAWHVILKL